MDVGVDEEELLINSGDAYPLALGNVVQEGEGKELCMKNASLLLHHRLNNENDGKLGSMEVAESFVSWRAATRIFSFSRKSRISALEFCNRRS